MSPVSYIASFFAGRTPTEIPPLSHSNSLFFSKLSVGLVFPRVMFKRCLFFRVPMRATNCRALTSFILLRFLILSPPCKLLRRTNLSFSLSPKSQILLFRSKGLVQKIDIPLFFDGTGTERLSAFHRLSHFVHLSPALI